jgi:uncharacterized lipoprotein YmbA
MLRSLPHRFLPVFFCALALAACSSPSSSVFSLSSNDAAAVGRRGPVRVTIGNVNIPKYLDRPQMVSRLNPVELKVDEFSRWSEPFSDMIQRVLADDLAKRLPRGSSVALQRNQMSTEGNVIDVAISTFEYGPQNAVILDAAWTAAGRSHHAHIVRPASGSNDQEIAIAMSSALGNLADEIARQL